ncbi:dihydrofolate reductase family protein [Sanguibacter sp. HDW7]|uniref:dihydrofolate reductase family protein n=1 Tax=Sanguibacter sp. HDW7 TaxID=2714931 RepID=UPI00140BEB93|nr:dihydrofolate reductase family protein [Sanguibacter sp. HDW7]QIK83859.1 dihydrofolate reductase family protein [Sanguibacter sp. HDW7]
MGEVTCDVTVSLDGYVAGPDQTREQPLGAGGELLHRWMFDFADEHAPEIARITQAEAFIMGRNMFGPVRGPWSEDWDGWWGPEPPYHAPTFVLTHHPRAPQPMEGGTTFYFVTDGPLAALALAREAAGHGDVAICGGASTIDQYLALDAIDELRLHVSPMTLGGGAKLFAGVRPGFTLVPTAARASDAVTFTTYRRRPD